MAFLAGCSELSLDLRGSAPHHSKPIKRPVSHIKHLCCFGVKIVFFRGFANFAFLNNLARVTHLLRWVCWSFSAITFGQSDKGDN